MQTHADTPADPGDHKSNSTFIADTILVHFPPLCKPVSFSLGLAPLYIVTWAIKKIRSV